MKILRSESPHFLALFLSLAAFVASVPSIAQGTFVAPIAYSNVEGEERSSFPFSYSDNPNGKRLQTIISPSARPVLPDGGVFLLGVRFRFDSSISGVGIGKFDFVRIALSTSTKALSEITTQFEENHGADKFIVFDSGPTDIEVKASGSSPEPFSLDFKFQQPFFYNSATGNLVIDIMSRGSRQTDNLFLDYARDTGSITVFSPFTSPSPTTSFGSLVSEFQYSLVPEPSTMAFLALLGTVLILVASVSRKRNPFNQLTNE